MGESLMEQRRVSEEGFRVVKLCCQGRISMRVTAHAMTVPEKKALGRTGRGPRPIS